jgi:hypothetical protein
VAARADTPSLRVSASFPPFPKFQTTSRLSKRQLNFTKCRTRSSPTRITRVQTCPTHQRSPQAVHLKLPAELLVQLGQQLNAKDLGHLRLTCLAVAVQLYPVLGSKISLPVAFDEDGCKRLESHTVSDCDHLQPLAPWVSAIRLADRGICGFMNAFHPTLELVFSEGGRKVRRLDQQSETGLYGTPNKYLGYRMWTEVYSECVSCHNIQKIEFAPGTTILGRAAMALQSFVRLRAIGACFKRVEIDLSCDTDSEQPRRIEISPNLDWKDENSVYVTRYGCYKHHEHVERTRTEGPLLLSFKWGMVSLVRPALLDLVRLDAQFDLQHSLPKTLQRLTLRLWPSTLSPVGTRVKDEGIPSLLCAFLERCQNLRRLRLCSDSARTGSPSLNFEGDMYHIISDITKTLLARPLPQLTHLKLDGDHLEALDYLKFVEAHQATLIFV